MQRLTTASPSVGPYWSARAHDSTGDRAHQRRVGVGRERRGVGQPARQRDHVGALGERHQVAHRRGLHHLRPLRRTAPRSARCPAPPTAGRRGRDPPRLHRPRSRRPLALSSRPFTVQHRASRLRHLPGDRHRRGGRNPAVPAGTGGRRARGRQRADPLRPHRLLFPAGARRSCSRWRSAPSRSGWPSGGSAPRAARARRAGGWCSRSWRWRSARCCSRARCAADRYLGWPGYIGGVVCAALGVAATRPLLARVRARLDARRRALLPLFAEGAAIAARGAVGGGATGRADRGWLCAVAAVRRAAGARAEVRWAADPG